MSHINNDFLKFARENLNLSLEEACKKLQIKDSLKVSAIEKLMAYENGKNQPTQNQVARMAQAYHKSLLSFYLPKIPKQTKRGEDFRTIQNLHTKENALLDILLRDIRARQDLLRETILEDDEEYKLTTFEKVQKSKNVKSMTSEVITAIDFDLKKFRGFRDVSESFKYLRMLVETKGIFVLLASNLGSHHTDIPVDVFRGFAIADQIAPMIVINSQDAKSAWCFTLLHELIHICIGDTGLSANISDNETEVFCNEVASLILLPEEDLNLFVNKLPNPEDSAKTIAAFALKNNLSASMVAYRLYKLNLLSQKDWQIINGFYHQKWKESKTNKNKSDSGPNYYVIKKQKLGNAILQFTKRMVSSGILTNTKAGFLLGVKPIKLNRILDLV